MFSKFGNGFLSGLKAFFTKDKMLILCIFLVLMWALVRYSTDKVTIVDKMTTGDSNGGEAPINNAQPAPEAATSSSPAGYDIKDVANPADLLPADKNSEWAELNPNTPPVDFLADNTKLHGEISVNKNPCYDIRPCPEVAKVETGPWNQSTIDNTK